MSNGGSTTIASVEHSADAVIVTWADAHRSEFPLRWLRYECVCEQCGESRSGIRFVTPIDASKGIAVENCRIDEIGDLEIQWSPVQHRSRYERSWLRQHCLEKASREARVHRPTTWARELESQLPRVSFDGFVNETASRCDAFEAIRDFGLVHIIEGPAQIGIAERLSACIGAIEETNFGRVFDLKSVDNATSIGATAHPASLHTDECYRNMPTGIKVIHCVKDSDPDTGYSLFADGFRIGELLEQTSPDAFELLCGQPVTFNRRYEDAIIVASAPIFSRDFDGRLVGFRFQDRSMAPLDVEPSEVGTVLDAISALMELIGEPENQLRLRLSPGEAVLFDNHRLLHGRTGFTGSRHLQLSSVNRDTFISEMRVLQRQLGRPGPYLQVASGASCGVSP